MKDWKHATQQEVDAMTFDEAVEILQKQINIGEKKVGEVDKNSQWCPRAHTTHAYQMILDRALLANGRRESLIISLKRNRELRDENTRLRYMLWEIINETHKDHYGDSALAYSIICDMLSEVEKQMREQNRDFYYKEMDILNPIETIITLKSLRNVVYAIEGLSFCCGNKSVAEDQCKAIDKAIAAVEKTIPQKVKRDPFGVECPNCGCRGVFPSTYSFGGKKIGIRCDYCYSCGQALDWGVE